MQCLTGAAGENNIPVDFCLSQLNKQRSLNWAVLPDKPSPIDGTIRPFGVIISIRGETEKNAICRQLFMNFSRFAFRNSKSNRLRFL